MKNKYQTLIICLILISGCNSPSVNLDGLWISENENNVILFRNDTISSTINPPVSYTIDGNTLITKDTFYSLTSNQIPFSIQDDKLSISLEENRLIEYKKSQFNNIFDHHVNNLGIKLNLQTGFSQRNLDSKTHYDFMYVGFSKDSSITIILDDKKTSLNDLSSYFKYSNNNSPYIHLAIAVDKNILFRDYIAIHHSITEQDSTVVKLEHAVRSKPFHLFANFPWEQVSYEKFRVNISSQLPELNNQSFDFITLEVDSNKKILLNGKVVKRENLYDRIVDLYSLNSKNKCFIITETDELTYGDFLWLASLENKVVLEQRNKYSLKNYNKNWQEIQWYDLSVKGSKNTRDSLTKHIKQSYPNRLVIQDL